ncbi:MAG: COX15/CtaA family protein [Betaproteobacteria bacterium]|nr:COX15/CtaA family protein [Betaproteobacteria bacterium]
MASSNVLVHSLHSLPVAVGDTDNRTVAKAMAIWLLICCAMVFAMVVVGGVTRLTHSGLSIVEWQPIVGAIPPLNDAEWQATFAKYQQTPEFKLRNFDMGVDEFKGIFWWEYFHRLLGRLIGIVYLLPLLVFVARRHVSATLAWKLGGILLLGAMQGAMGWYMVKSGLVDEPRVSHLRLTAHLALAFLIFAAQFWVALDLLKGERPRPAVPAGLVRFSRILVAIVSLMVLSGGLVAGLRAGLAYNTFPLMHGHVVPPDMFVIDPWYANFIGNLATVQFDHRLIAWLLAALIPMLWWRVQRSNASRPAKWMAHGLLATLVAQFTLGVATLLLGVPVAIAATHQAGAMVLFGVSLALAHELG